MSVKSSDSEKVSEPTWAAAGKMAWFNRDTAGRIDSSGRQGDVDRCSRPQCEVSRTRSSALASFHPNLPRAHSRPYIGILGNFSHYWIADAMSMQIQRLNELYAETNQVGFIGRLETERAGARGGVCPAEAGLRKWRGGVARRKSLLHALIKECAWRKPWPNAARGKRGS